MDLQLINALTKWSEEKIKYFRIADFAHTRLLLAVSGGKDSLFLFYLVLVWYRTGKLHYSPIIFHLDHQLRKDSSQDLEFVRKLAHRHSLQFYSHSISLEKFIQKKPMNLEEAARLVRYSHLIKIASKLQKNNKDINVVICTGHHADDFLESSLMHLTRGGGKGAFATMPLWQRIEEFILLRPLMGIDSTEITQQCRLLNLAVRNDATNRNLAFFRNRMRKKIIPLLKAEGLQPSLTWKNMHNRHRPWSVDQFIVRPQKKIDYLYLDRFCMNTPQLLKDWLDLSSKLLSVLPLGNRFITEIYRQWNNPKKAQRLHTGNKSLLIWNDSRSPIYLMRKDSPCMRQAQISQIISGDKIKYRIQYNRQQIVFEVNQDFEVVCFSPGLRMKTSYGSKKLKKIFQELSLPPPVRKNIPLLYHKKQKKITRIFLELWKKT